MEEIWKDIKGYEGLYQVSNLGRIKSLSRTITKVDGNTQTFKERILKPNYKRGYVNVGLSKKGKLKTFTVHRLVAEAFKLNPDNKPEVNHINGIKDDNRVSNLEWNTSAENQRHAYNTGLQISQKGSKHGKSTLTDKIVLAIRASKNKTHQQLADEFQISRQHIGNIINRKKWKHI